MRRLLKAAGILVVSAAAVAAYLVRFHGLRMEVDGSGSRPVLSFYKPERHMSAIEQSRAAEVPAAEETATAAPALPVKEPGPAPYWTDFRGPRRDGRYDEMPVLPAWPAGGPARMWRRPVGGGYASMVVADGRVFTIEQRRGQEVATAYDLATGREAWSHGWEALFQESMGGDGPRATPAWDEGRLYVLGAEGELRCLDAASGRKIWSKNILRDAGAQNLQWGMSAAPLVVDGKVIVLPGGPAGKSVAAYDKLTGDVVWTALDDKQSYTSPMLVTLAGERQILAVSAHRAVGLTADGKLLWEYPWQTQYDINSSQPLITGSDRFILSAGYGHGAALVRVVKDGASFRAGRVWENTRMKNKFTSSVLYEGHMYGLDESILACMDAESGELKWKGGRYGFGQVMVAGGNVIVLAEDGDLALVRATPERHDELTRFHAIDGKTWNHPAIAHGVLLVRNTTEMSAFRLR